ncbi:hypothetical protein BaRGS_00016308 [Batillaria attramentaria]|uniref:Uncharacterized protein n=1 Tax=Batillaria attramentaria TaxID=370345 RepID=A0ABD0KZB6_9CAEN
MKSLAEPMHVIYIGTVGGKKTKNHATKESLSATGTRGHIVTTSKPHYNIDDGSSTRKGRNQVSATACDKRQKRGRFQLNVQSRTV